MSIPSGDSGVWNTTYKVGTVESWPISVDLFCAGMKDDERGLTRSHWQADSDAAASTFPGFPDASAYSPCHDIRQVYPLHLTRKIYLDLQPVLYIGMFKAFQARYHRAASDSVLVTQIYDIRPTNDSDTSSFSVAPLDLKGSKLAQKGSYLNLEEAQI